MTGLEAPVIIAIIGATAAVVGAGVAIKGQMDAAKAAKRAAAVDAENKRNQDIASQRAFDAESKLKKKRFILAAGRNEAIGSSSGAEGFGDLFVADVTTFEAEHLLLAFNRDVFGVNQRNAANISIFEGDTFAAAQTTKSIGTGIAAVGAVATSFQGLKSSTPSTTGTALGGSTSGSTGSGFAAPYATSPQLSTFA
jgi:hypothetical protein